MYYLIQKVNQALSTEHLSDSKRLIPSQTRHFFALVMKSESP